MVIAAALVGLFFAAGAYAGIVREGGGSNEAQESAASSVEKAPVPAFKATEGPVASQNSEATHAPADKTAPEESLDVLVLGVDQRPGATGGSSSHSDTMMLVRVSPETGRIQSLSVPRDLLVEVKPGVEDRINTAYLYGGVEQAAAVMEDLTGISADRYAVVDFGGFEDMVNALGGGHAGGGATNTARHRRPSRVHTRGKARAGRAEGASLRPLPGYRLRRPGPHKAPAAVDRRAA
jgi:hypothetical protein